MLLGLLQNDASLLACRLAQLRDLLDFTTEKPPDAVGAGYVENGQALVQRRPGTAPALAADVLDLVKDVKATGLVVHIRRATIGGFKDENTHPFRYRNWLFAHSGTVAHFGDLRPALIEGLPPFLQRMIVGETDSEHIFALFLDELRKGGAIENLHPDQDSLGRAMVRTVERVESLAHAVGAGAVSTLNMVATNGRGLVACRHGDGSALWFAELGGLAVCDFHALTESAAETHAQRLPHRNMRSVVVSGRVRSSAREAFTELTPGQVMAAGPDLVARIYDY